MDILEIVRALSEAPGVSGFESAVRSLIREQWRPYVDDMREDALGNLIAVRRGQPADEGRRHSLLVAAHCDEIGLMVTGIERGFLRFTSVGGVDARVLPGQEVTVHGRQPALGLISLRPIHVLSEAERKKPAAMSDLFIDVGMTQADAEAIFSLGDPITLRVGTTELQNERVAGKAFDDRASVAALSLFLSYLHGRHHAWDVYAVATTQEEVGLRGATVSAFGIMPDVGIAVDVTFGQGPGLSDDDTFEMDGGPVLGMGPNVHPALYAALVDQAGALEMQVQTEPMPGSSGTDGWAIQVARDGIPTAVVMVPVQNMHTPAEVVCLRDIRRVSRLLAAFVRSLDDSIIPKLIPALPEVNANS